eukprot:SAG11_NODE_4962_length_1709_cov_1.090062_2_plen_203_part_00
MPRYINRMDDDSGEAQGERRSPRGRRTRQRTVAGEEAAEEERRLRVVRQLHRLRRHLPPPRAEAARNTEKSHRAVQRLRAVRHRPYFKHRGIAYSCAAPRRPRRAASHPRPRRRTRPCSHSRRRRPPVDTPRDRIGPCSVLRAVYHSPHLKHRGIAYSCAAPPRRRRRRRGRAGCAVARAPRSPPASRRRAPSRRREHIYAV